VNQPQPVNRVERQQHLHHDLLKLRRKPTCEMGVERNAVVELHCEKGAVFGGGAEVYRVDDAGMQKTGKVIKLAAQPEFGLPWRVLPQDLNGKNPAGHGVRRFVNFGMLSTAQKRYDPVTVRQNPVRRISTFGLLHRSYYTGKTGQVKTVRHLRQGATTAYYTAEYSVSRPAGAASRDSRESKVVEAGRKEPAVTRVAAPRPCAPGVPTHGVLTGPQRRLDCRVPLHRARIVRDILLVVAGSAVVALSYVLFLIPHKVVPGGVGGISMILAHFFRTPVGLVIIILNVPLFVLGARTMGTGYAAKSVLGIALSSGLIDFFEYAVPVGPATDNPILAAVFGGIMLGTGLGLVFRGGGSTGGSDIVGQLLGKTTNFSTGTALLVVDGAVITAAGISFGSFELALYGFLNLYLSTRAIDIVLEGLSYTRAMFIISTRAEEIARV